MKRSGGVTALAIILILAGSYGAFIAMASSSRMGMGRFEDVGLQVKEQLDGLPTGTEKGKVPPARLAQLRARLEQDLQQLREIVTSPSMRMSWFLYSLLGVAALVAGIGVLLLKGWARTLVIWQAGLSVGAGLWWNFGSPWMSFQKVFGDMMGILLTANSPEMQGQVQPMMHALQTFGQWVGVFLLVVWNGFLIWFFNRASVKAQFQPAPAGVSGGQGFAPAASGGSP